MVAAPPATAEATPAERRPGTPTPVRLALGGVVCIAFVLNCWALSRNGLGNTYYSAATRSMTASWRNFFFASFDPGGFITVDKPPVALWFQALSVRTFGYSSWTLLLPGALAGTASVAILFSIVRRHFGAVAATIAALVLAVSPVSVSVNRLNLPEPFMILFLVAAAWAVLRSLDAARPLVWLAVAGGFAGLAFNTKTLAAAIAFPALGLAVLVGSRDVEDARHPGCGARRRRRGRVAVVGPRRRRDPDVDASVRRWEPQRHRAEPAHRVQRPRPGRRRRPARRRVVACGGSAAQEGSSEGSPGSFVSSVTPSDHRSDGCCPSRSPRPFSASGPTGSAGIASRQSCSGARGSGSTRSCSARRRGSSTRTTRPRSRRRWARSSASAPSPRCARSGATRRRRSSSPRSSA